MSCLDTLPPTAAQGVVIPPNIRDADRAALDQHVAEIRQLHKRAVGGILEIGRRLVECKKLVATGIGCRGSTSSLDGMKGPPSGS